MNILICGSRLFTDYVKFKKLIEPVLSQYSDITIISGGARGTDTLAKQYAVSKNIPFKEYLADWDNLGKRAGYVRNKIMVDEAEYCIAFIKGESKGTKHSINLAKVKNIPISIFEV